MSTLKLSEARLLPGSSLKKAFDIIEIIADHPEIGAVENQEKSIRGFSISRHNRLFYRIEQAGPS